MTASEPGPGETIDAEIARFVATILGGGPASPDGIKPSLQDQREAAEAARMPWRQGGPDMHRVRDVAVELDGLTIRVRLFEPSARPDPGPALIYCHGGGFTLFSLDSHDRMMREYAGRSGFTVVGVDYSLSPEARFPVALHEVVAVVEWLHASGHDYGIDPQRIAIGGDSAGANLSLAACLKLRDSGRSTRIKAMLFNYGFFDNDFDTPSQRRHGGEGKLLTTDELAGYLENYLGDLPRTDPLSLPALAELHDLPQSFHVVAPCDPLADGDRRIAERLRDAGNQVTVREYPGATHSFLEAVAISRLADRAFAESSVWLRGVLQPAALVGA